MIKTSPYSNWPFPLYAYFLRTYPRYFLSGKCLPFPRTIQLQTQSRCNGQCVVCPYRIVSKTQQHGVMEWDLFTKIAGELKMENQSPTLMFALHNEPLLDARIFDMVQHMKSANPGCYCILATNGELLDTFGPDRIKESGLDQLNLTLNADSRETYEQINIGIDYDRVMRNIDRLLSDPVFKHKLQIMFVLNEINAHEARQTVDRWKQRGVRTKVIGITSRAGALDNYENLRLKNGRYSPPPLLRAWKKLTGYARTVNGCDVPFYQMNILFNGDVILCGNDWKKATIIGNVKDSSIRSVWNSDTLNRFRHLVHYRRYGEIDTCRDFPVSH